MAGHGHIFQGFAHAEENARSGLDGEQTHGERFSAAKSIPTLSAGQKLPECQRLIVLIPNAEIAQDVRLPQRIWQLAAPGKVRVIYLAMAGDYESEMSARRQLTLLAAMTRDKRVTVEIQITHRSSWVPALRSIAQEGDVILSYSGQTVRKGVFGAEALCDQLGRCLRAPIYLLSGYALEEARKRSPLLHLALSGGLLGLILIGFFALDAQVIDQLKGTLQQVMLLILLLIEIGAIWAWNVLAG